MRLFVIHSSAKAVAAGEAPSPAELVCPFIQALRWWLLTNGEGPWIVKAVAGSGGTVSYRFLAKPQRVRVGSIYSVLWPRQQGR
jgi:hypothetical protein